MHQLPVGGCQLQLSVGGQCDAGLLSIAEVVDTEPMSRAKVMSGWEFERSRIMCGGLRRYLLQPVSAWLAPAPERLQEVLRLHERCHAH